MNEDFDKRLEEVKSWLQKEFAGIRTGQASPAILDGVRVESYGVLVPLIQVGSISVEDARTLRVSPWDASQIAAIERAIGDANLGVSVLTDSSGIRVKFPELTAERRTQLLKLAKSKLEDSRISVRGIRDEEMKLIDKQSKEGAIGEDEKFTRKEKVQTKIDAMNKTLEELFDKKEVELQK
ncbi:MAG: ribosome recycling factor [Patescibacteria group bacterium]